MPALNSCNFIGRIGQDPEKHMTQSGKSVCSFSIAVTEKYNNKETTTWIRLTAWDKLSEVISNYCHKGSLIYVSAAFQMQKWTDKNGQEKESPNFTVRSLQMLDSKQSSQQQPNQQYQQPQQNYQDHQVPPSNDDYLEDLIPF